MVRNLNGWSMLGRGRDRIDTATFAKVLDNDFVLDAGYRLNVTMMRHSESVFAKFHIQAFAVDIFREIHAAASP